MDNDSEPSKSRSWYNMKNPKEEMPEKEKDMRVHHSTTNIIRAIVLLKRADNTLTFAMRSLEGTEMNTMSKDVWNTKCIIEEEIKRLYKYIYK